MKEPVIERVVSSIVRVDKLSLLLEVSNALIAEKTLERLLKIIVEKTTILLEADRSSIFLLDYDTNELYTKVAQLKEASEIRIPAGQGIAGFVAKSAKLVNIPDAYKDSRFNPDVDKKTGYLTRNILCSPMLNRKNEVVGVLQVLNKKKGSFSLEDEHLIMALTAQAAVAIENAQLYQELELTLKSFLSTLASAIDARDPTTAGHSERVARLAINMGKALGFNEIQLKMIDYAAALHDTGKIGVPDSILLKPDKLTPEEYEIMKQHAIRTKEILDNMFFARELREIPHIASTHHERLDGSGYPLRLKGGEMTLSAKILAVADVYDALVSQDRPYKKAMSHEQAMAILEQGRDKHFDGHLLDIFKEKNLYLIERRKSPRFPLEIPFVFRSKLDSKERSGKTINISTCGLLIANQRLYPLGTECDITMRLDDKEYCVKGRIARVDKKLSQNLYYLGISFVDPACIDIPFKYRKV
jgi:HD-GYP domain-containing protein (c-di-GMP phosphodiesterase class II)